MLSASPRGGVRLFVQRVRMLRPRVHVAAHILGVLRTGWLTGAGRAAWAHLRRSAEGRGGVGREILAVALRFGGGHVHLGRRARAERGEGLAFLGCDGLDADITGNGKLHHAGGDGGAALVLGGDAGAGGRHGGLGLSEEGLKIEDIDPAIGVYIAIGAGSVAFQNIRDNALEIENIDGGVTVGVAGCRAHSQRADAGGNQHCDAHANMLEKADHGMICSKILPTSGYRILLQMSSEENISAEFSAQLLYFRE